MTRLELTKKISEMSGVDRKGCEAVVKAALEEILKALEKDEKVVIQGFGAFDTQVAAERVFRNPVTRRRMLYPKKRKMKFKPSKALKDKINESQR